MKKCPHWFPLICLLAALCLWSGCAINVKPRMSRLDFASRAGEPSPRIDKKVALVLSDQFVNYDQKLQRGTQPYNFYLGPSLEAYARRTAETFFASVEVVRGEKAAPSASADLILVPSVHKSDLTSFVTIFEKQYLTIDVEWSLRRRGQDTPIWLSTIEGKGEGKAAKPAIIESAVNDLWQQTIPAFRKMQNLELLRQQ
jgi:hypothetical protein